MYKTHTKPFKLGVEIQKIFLNNTERKHTFDATERFVYTTKFKMIPHTTGRSQHHRILLSNSKPVTLQKL